MTAAPALAVRPARAEDYPTILAIYRHARDFMIASGNPHQWGHAYPDPALVLADIQAGRSYVIFDDTGVHGVFVAAAGEDPTYRRIEDGAWCNQAPYLTIHRIAGDGQVHGLLACAVRTLQAQTDNIRIDTHRDNHVMQRQILRCGFTRCGTIYTRDGTPRIAYQWTRQPVAAEQE